MNSDKACHEIVDCPGLYVDAFRGAYLRDKIHDLNNAFILTHYHGDHYGSLPREGKYSGPALIHCTPVTAALLRTVHQVPARFVVEHKYGDTWSFAVNPNEKRTKGEPSSPDSKAGEGLSKGGEEEKVRITFYDANHCPGAAIVAVQFSNGRVHLHTGDMRYHANMKEYPVIRNAVANRNLDLVYLDTTYGHPKHDFVPQQIAVNSIASHVHQLLGSERRAPTTDNNTQPRILVLLSCYSIGKEKVLWEVSTRTNQPVYVTERKLKMMQCIHSPSTIETSQRNTTDVNELPCSQMIERCTRDQNASDIHVIPMGLAGELWPFFKPNYRNCVDYAEDLSLRYDKVVAFIPTGWANASNWNKKNAVSRKQLECRKSKRFMDVEIRLISYSEHSAFTELSDFVQYLKPRKIIPTVFSDDKDCRRIEKLFKKYVDSSRAKLQFFRKMNGGGTESHSAAVSAAKHATNSVERAANECNIPSRSNPKIPLESARVTLTDNSDALIDLTVLSDEEDTNIHDREECAVVGGTPENTKQNNVTGESGSSLQFHSSSRTKRSPLPTSLSGDDSTPAKRKRKSTPNISTPTITTFFSAKAKR